MAVPIDGTGIVSVETMKALPVPGVQKPPRRVGKWLWDHLGAAPEQKEKTPAGLKTRPPWLWAVRLGVRSRAGLQGAEGDDLIPGPDSDGEGTGSAVQNGAGAVVERLERWNDAALMDPDEGGREELHWQLARQLDTRIVPRQRNSGNIQLWPCLRRASSRTVTRPS